MADPVNLATDRDWEKIKTTKSPRGRYPNVRRTRARDGRVYPSKVEALYADKLLLAQERGLITSYAPQHCVDLIGANGRPLISPRTGKPLRAYIDFLVHLPNGTRRYLEIKGNWEDDSEVRSAVLAAMFPGLYHVIPYEDARRPEVLSLG